MAILSNAYLKIKNRRYKSLIKRFPLVQINMRDEIIISEQKRIENYDEVKKRIDRQFRVLFNLD